jgi:hypothetical protein
MDRKLCKTEAKFHSRYYITCIDGEEHTFEDCPYVNPAKRTDGWKADPKIEQEFEQLKKAQTPRAKKLRYVKKQLNSMKKDDKESLPSVDTNKNGDKNEVANLVYDANEYCTIVFSIPVLQFI